jgi:hypothetical protein
VANFTERHAAAIRGVLSCFDRIVLTGTLPDICHPVAMERYLRQHNIRLFDLPRAMEPLRDRLRENAEKLAAEAGVEIEYVRRKDFRKEERVREVLRTRGTEPGLVHIFSALEPCSSFKPWHDKQTHRTYLKPDSGKCLHYYFYFIDAALGLCFLRVPTWAPFRLQFYCNGHNVLAAALERSGISCQLADNAFLGIADFTRAQALADEFDVRRLHRRLDGIAQRYCPVIADFAAGVHWSIMQAEYATDVVFRSRAALAPIYDHAVRTAIHAVKAEHVATFLGKRLDGRFRGELGSDFSTRIQGTRIKHSMRRVSIKMYDKAGVVLRIETTVNDVTFFSHYRTVEHRDGTSEQKRAPLKKTIYSLPVLAERARAANRRYLEFLAALGDPGDGLKNLDRISRPAWQHERSYRGFNLFSGEDRRFFEVISRGEFNLRGFKNSDIRNVLPHLTPSQTGRLLKRLRLHGLIRKTAHGYRYHLTAIGRRCIAAALKVREFVVIPTLATALS